MSPTLTKYTALIATAVAAEIIVRLLPAIASALVTAAYVLHPEAAKAEMERRS